MDTKTYYIYAYIRIDNTPYYIGMGSGKRAYKKGKGEIGKPSFDQIVIMENNLTKTGALALERFYIRWYGRIDNNTGILRNRTYGGDAPSGVKPSPETCAKISLKAKGRVFSKIHRQRLSQNNCNNDPEVRKKKAIANANLKYICTDPNGIEYRINNLSEFCREHNLLRASMREIYTGRYSQHKGWKCKLDPDC